MIEGWESHWQWQGSEWNVKCTFLSKGSSTTDPSQREKCPEFHVNVPIFKYWQFIQGSKFKCKTLWANTVLEVFSVSELEFRIASSILTNTIWGHKAGTRAGLPVVFTVRRGQKETGNYRIYTIQMAGQRILE